jgi:lysozyme
MNRDLLTADLERDEGLRLKAYKCTAGKVTVGIGRNLDDLGITKSEAYMLLGGDIDRISAELDKSLPWWRQLSEPRARALANLTFNLGIVRLLGFPKMLAALHQGQYAEAARQLLDSRYAQQVGSRANRVASLIEKG